MNYPIISSHHGHPHWFKDLQFAVGVVVAIGGAAVLLSQLASLFV